jgi:hypothetical protein
MRQLVEAFMLESLEKAFAEAAKLPPAEQEWLARFILAELESERRWDEAFARSGDVLERLADEALEDYHRGDTEPLDPDSL